MCNTKYQVVLCCSRKHQLCDKTVVCLFMILFLQQLMYKAEQEYIENSIPHIVAAIRYMQLL